MKKISVILVAFIFMFMNMSYTKAASIINEGTILNDNGQPFFIARDPNNPSYFWQKLKTAEGSIAYCLDYGKDWPASGGVNYNDNVDPADAGLIYIIEHGAENYNNPTNEERYLTQGAIWLYITNSNSFSPEFDDPNGLLSRMNSLVREAKQARDSGSVNNSVINEINVDSTNMTASGDKYVSSAIKPNITGADTYTVSADGGYEGGPIDDIEILSTDGTKKTTFNVGESFIVRIPKVGPPPVSVEVSVSINTKAHVISPAGNSGYQRVITLGDLGDTDKKITKSITLSLAPVCVDYKIVGDVIPDANLTDPTPESKCYDKGIPYTQEKKLTTKTNCTFKGWYTSSELTGEWTDGTALDNDMTLYGAWECEKVSVPSTAASTSLIILGSGLVLVAGGFGYYIFQNKKKLS